MLPAAFTPTSGPTASRMISTSRTDAPRGPKPVEVFTKPAPAAALKCAARLPELDRVAATFRGRPLRQRIGLNTGDALVGEHERLQARMNQFYDRFEATLKQALRAAADGDAAAHAAALLRYAIGSLHQFAKSGFARKPTEGFAVQRAFLSA